jgi:hypothetical protein
VEIAAVIRTRAELDRVLAGWDAAMQRPDGVSWLRERIAQHRSGYRFDSTTAPTWPAPSAPPHELSGSDD